MRVPKATVVITNPTEFAVAIEYNEDKMKAPLVVAKGMGFVAQKIREVAISNGVPVIQRPELARALFKACEVDQSIPEKLYKAVAEVLAFVFHIKADGLKVPALSNKI